MRKIVQYSFGTIVLYLLVANATNSGNLIKAGAAGARSIINGFQGAGAKG